MLRPRAKQQAPCQRCSQHSSQLRFGGRVTFPVLHHATSALMQKTSCFLDSRLFAIARRRIARDVGIIAPERAQRGLSGKPSAEFPKTLCSFQQPGARAAHWRPARAQQPATSNTYVAPNRAPPGGRKPTAVSPGRLGLRIAALAGICAVLIAIFPPSLADAAWTLARRRLARLIYHHQTRLVLGARVSIIRRRAAPCGPSA